MTAQSRERPIDPRDQQRIFEALENWAADGEFLALRMRAFGYLLADGALRTKSAVWLDCEEVVKDPSAQRIVVVQQVTQRPCEANAYRGRKFLLSDRSRQAIADYLKVARDEGWLKKASELKGPLWIATHHHGTQQRMSQRTASAAWVAFLQEHLEGKDYQLDDLVMAGRLTFLAAAELSTDVLSEHAGLTRRAAEYYRDRLQPPPSSNTPKQIMSQLNRQQRSRGPKSK